MRNSYIKMDIYTVTRYHFEKSKRQKILRTSCLFMAWICLGLFLEITGPTLIDLKIRSGTDYNEISWAVASVNIGFFIGAIIGGVIVDRFVAFCDLILAFGLTGAATFIAAVPWTKDVQLMWLFILLTGVFEGIISTSGHRMMLMMWRERSASLLNLLHGGFGIGAFTIPLIANPFLAVTNTVPLSNISDIKQTNKTRDLQFHVDDFKANVNISTETTTVSMEDEQGNTSSPVPNSFRTVYIKESRIEYAYLIAASIIIFTSLLFYMLQIVDSREMKTKKGLTRNRLDIGTTRSKRNIKSMINPATCTNGRFLYGVAIFSTMFLFYFNLVGGERSVGVFIRAYSVEQLNFSVDDGSYINTAFWISFTAGRFLGSVAARWIPIRVFLFIQTGGVLLVSIFLRIFGASNSLALWILVQALGIFSSMLFPSGMAWTNVHAEMTGLAISVHLFGGALGGTTYVRLAGFLFETYGPQAFLYHIMGYGIIAFTLTVILHFIGSLHGSRFDKAEGGIPGNSMKFNNKEDNKPELATGKLLETEVIS